MALKELSEVYKDIYGNYYEIFMPLNNDYNESCIKKFCSNDASPQEKPKVRQAFENVMLEVCQKDEHIYGVYFRRLSDDTRYLYVGEKQRMQEVSWKLNEEFIEQSYVRYMVGGRRLGEAKELLSLEEQISVFGIQSGIMPGERTAPELKYQITALYDTTFFDTILKKYDVSPEARFLITSSQGLIFYDSANVYGTGESYFEEIENVKGKEKEILLDDNVWVKNLVELSQNKFLAFYIVPQSSIIGFSVEWIYESGDFGSRCHYNHDVYGYAGH